MDNNIYQSIEDIDKMYNNYSISVLDIYKYCIDIKTLFEINILTILNKTIWHLYNYNLSLSEKDSYNLYKLNYEGIFTCDLFNKPSILDLNLLDQYIKYGYDEIDDGDISYNLNKKFISFYINNNSLEYILDKLNNNFDNDKFSIIVEDEIKNINKEKLINNKIDKYILNYNLNNSIRYILPNMYDLINFNLNSLNPNIKKELDANYTFVVLIENELETNTDIIELLMNSLYN
jgi:hypothetical protein